MSNKSYQQIQLESAPERTLSFLRAIATNRQIRVAMSNVGYTDAEQSEGWRLLLAATGYATSRTAPEADVAARQAIAELDDWDEPGFRRIHAALERLHPEQDAAVFAGIEATRGAGAVVGIAKLLDRLEQLEKGSEADRAAMATLEKRGIDTKQREHLRDLVAVAQAAKPVEQPTVEAVSEQQQVALEALSAWLRDWSETARAVIRRRDLLVLMGLAKRRSKKDDSEEEEAVVEVPGQVPATTPVGAVPPVVPAVIPVTNAASTAAVASAGAASA